MATQYLLLGLKLVVVPAGLAWLGAELLQDPRMGAISFEPWMLVAALAVNQVALTLFAMRMQLALRAFGIALGLLQALRVHLQSVFYFFALPMTVGLEIARFAKIKALATPRAGNAQLAYALLADRVLGALAAFLIAVALLPFVDLRGLGIGAVPAWLPWGGAALALTGGIFLHAKARTHLVALLAACRDGRAMLGAALVTSVLTHCCFALAIHVAAAGTGIQLGYVQSLFAISAAMLFVVVPVSFAGVSPVEAASVGVLIALGLPLEQAALFTLLCYLAKLVAAFEGAAWEIGEGGGQLKRLLADPARADQQGTTGP